MAEFILKDQYGKEKVFDHDKIFVRGTDGELVQFTQGAGVSPDVSYVTFMSYDGLTEYGKKPVAIGDDCADPIARGIFSTPTRESDVQYNYTFYGWATTPNGAADSNWNKAITEDKTVYANFASAVRYYTITYYDSDGTTVLKTESLAYGAMPNYVAEKDGVGFGGWTPELATVTGNASYTAVWVEKITFANASWADIARISETGKASEHFTIGETKVIDFAASDGTAYQATLQIADFAHDPLASDETVMAGMTIDCKMVYDKKTLWASQNHDGQVPGDSYWSLDDHLAEVKTKLPSELQAVIKVVKKNTRITAASDKFITFNAELFPYSLSELGTTGDEWGTPYPVFGGIISNKIATRIDTGEPVMYWLRDFLKNNSWVVKPRRIGTDGSVITTNISNMATEYHYVRFGFCI